MLIFLFLMALYIIIPTILMGYIFGIFLFKSGPMLSSDLKKLLGLFFGATLLWLYVEQVVGGYLRFLPEHLFSVSGHFIVSAAILSVGVIILSILRHIIVNPWQMSIGFPRLIERSVAGNIRNAQNEEGEILLLCWGKYLNYSAQSGSFKAPCNVMLKLIKRFYMRSIPSILNL